MQKVLIVPVLAAMLSAAACGEDPLTPGPIGTASVRFFNATPGMTGSGGFTINGEFAAGSALAFGQLTQTCATVGAGSKSFGFGAANAGGSGLSGNALATLNNRSLADGGKYAVVASGSATSPTLFLLEDNFSGVLGPNQTAVRFVNLAPGTGATANTFDPYRGTVGGNHSQLIATNIAVGAPTSFAIMPSGPNVFSVTQGATIVLTGSTADLQAGSVNTMAIVPKTSGGFELINIPRCS